MVSQLPKTFRPPLAELTAYDLRMAILYTLAYSDIFDFPLTTEEIHRYLIGLSADLADVEVELVNLRASLIGQGEHFALPGRENNFQLRRSRAELSAVLWRDAMRYGRWISRLPYVRMVAVTGALVSNNVEAGADLDYFIITEPDWLWTTRAAILAMDRIASSIGTRAHICPNYMITTNNLALSEQDLFTAQEMARMVPIAGLDLYSRFRMENYWTDNFLPNAQGHPLQPTNGSTSRTISTAAERLMINPISRRIEKWEMQRKIRKFSAMVGENTETRFSADLCKGHFDGHKRLTLDAFENKVRQLGLGQ
jgi:hypothetical protein